MNSENFQPTNNVSTKWLSELFSLMVSKNKVNIPKTYKDHIVYIKASGNLKDKNYINWKKENDQ